MRNEPWLVRKLHAFYNPLLDKVVERPKLLVVPSR